MSEKVHNVAEAMDIKTDTLYYYALYTTLNVGNNGRGMIGQNNYNTIINFLNFRTTITYLSDAEFSPALSQNGASFLKGPGYHIIFGVEDPNCYENFCNDGGSIGPVGYLIDDFHNKEVYDGKICTIGKDKNLEFRVWRQNEVI